MPQLEVPQRVELAQLGLQRRRGQRALLPAADDDELDQTVVAVTHPRPVEPHALPRRRVPLPVPVPEAHVRPLRLKLRHALAPQSQYAHVHQVGVGIFVVVILGRRRAHRGVEDARHGLPALLRDPERDLRAVEVLLLLLARRAPRVVRVIHRRESSRRRKLCASRRLGGERRYPARVVAHPQRPRVPRVHLPQEPRDVRARVQVPHRQQRLREVLEHERVFRRDGQPPLERVPGDVGKGSGRGERAEAPPQRGVRPVDLHRGGVAAEGEGEVGVEVRAGVVFDSLRRAPAVVFPLGRHLLLASLGSVRDEPAEVLERQELNLRHRRRERHLRGVVLRFVLRVVVGVRVLRVPRGLWGRGRVLLDGAMVRRSRHHVVVEDGPKLPLRVLQRPVAHEQQRVLVLGRESGFLGLGRAPGGGPGGGGAVPATAPGRVVEGGDLKSHGVWIRRVGRLSPPRDVPRWATSAPRRWVRSGRAIFGPTRARVPLRRPAPLATALHLRPEIFKLGVWSGTVTRQSPRKSQKTSVTSARVHSTGPRAPRRTTVSTRLIARRPGYLTPGA